MSRQPSPQRQLFTVRQIVVVVGIIICLTYVVSYSSRVLAGIKARNEEAAWQQAVARQQDRTAELTKRIENSDSPDIVEIFARDDRNWVKENDRPVAPMMATPIPQPTLSPAEQPTPTPIPNWQAWMGLLVDGKSQ